MDIKNYIDKLKWIIDIYILGHHPRCVAYKTDTYNIMGIRICKGGILTYTGFFYGMVLGLFALFYQQGIWFYFWTTGLILLVALSIEVARLKYYTPRWIPRALLGFSLAFLTYFILLLPELWMQISFYFAVLAGLALTIPIRIKSMKNRCRENCGEGNHFKNCGVLDYNKFAKYRKENEWIPLIANRNSLKNSLNKANDTLSDDT